MSAIGRFLLMTWCAFTVTACALSRAPHVYTPAEGASFPEVVSRVMPQSNGVKGVVVLEFVVLKDGTASDARVVRPLDPALDEPAIVALRQWRFKPGMKAGKPVAVRMNETLNF